MIVDVLIESTMSLLSSFFFFLNDPAPPEFSPLPLHAALPFFARWGSPRPFRAPRCRGQARALPPAPFARSPTIRRSSDQPLPRQFGDAVMPGAQPARDHLALPCAGRARDMVEIVGGSFIMRADDRRSRRHPDRRNTAARTIDPHQLL